MKGITTILYLRRERAYLSSFINKILEKNNEDDKRFYENIMDLIKQFVTKRPPNYGPPKPLSENHVIITLPDDIIKDPLYYNFLSQNSCEIIESKIDEWVKDYYIYQVKELSKLFSIHNKRKRVMNVKNITYLFLDRNNISYNKFDMFYKHYFRYVKYNKPIFIKNISPILLRSLSYTCPISIY